MVLSGFSTATLAVVGVARYSTGMVACKEVAETKVVVSASPFHEILLPFTKLVPVAVSVIAGLPVMTVAGLREVSVGGADGIVPVTVKGSSFESLLPVSSTPTLIVPATATLLAGR